MIHAGWNLISKQGHPTLAFFWTANNFGVLLVLAAAAACMGQVTRVPVTVWLYALCSGFFLSLYMIGLAGAYRTGDMSVAYPLIRALPVLFITGVTLVLGLGKPVTHRFMLGAVLVVTGCMLLPMRTGHYFKLRNYFNASALMALLAAVGSTGYTVIDHEALKYLRGLPETPFSSMTATRIYLCLAAMSGSLWMTLVVFADPRERKYFQEVMTRYKTSAAMTGIAIYLTYGLVLLAMNFVSNVSYVAAFRQLSIPLGAVFGMVVLREPPYRTKILGILAVFVGLVIIGLTNQTS